MNSILSWYSVRRLAATLLLCVPLVAQSQGISITEFIDDGTPAYRVVNNSHLTLTPVSIFGFAASNNDSGVAYTTRSGWVADIVSQAAWDAGYEVVHDFGGVLFTTSSLGSFNSFFGSASQVNMYWAGLHYGYDINPGESSSQFFWQGPLASDFVAFTYDGKVLAVPEPENFAMLLAGLGVIGFATRRRKQKAA